MKTFSRGIQLKDNKQGTEQKPIREAALPRKVILPLQQNLGCPNELLVNVGDVVLEGQKIADSPKYISAPLHAPLSGKVTKIEKLPNPCGFDVSALVIEAEEGRESHALAGSKWTVDELSPEQIRKIVREAGIVGMGGAAFPTHVKLSPPPGKKIDTIIINGCECEPYITADYRLMLERTEDVFYGAQAIAKAVGASRIVLGVESNKKEAVGLLKIESLPALLPARNAISMAGGRKAMQAGRKQKAEHRAQELEIVELKTKYPQGGEKMLIKAILGREVPSGGLPMEVGVIVQNVGTAVAIAEAVKLGKPLIQRVVTVTGSGIKNPQNLYVRIGTTFQDLIDQCGGLTEDAAKVIMGGPMTGLSVSSLELPVVKATNGILVLNRSDAKVFEEKDCIRCGRCIQACPTGLMPNFLANYAKIKDWDKTEDYHVADCIECGCCAYVCPSRIFLVQYFKAAKQALQMRKTVCR